VSLIFVDLLLYENILTTKFSQITVVWLACGTVLSVGRGHIFHGSHNKEQVC